MDHSSSSRKRLPSLWYLPADVTPTSSLPSISRDKELETDFSSIPVRFVLVVKLERMLALEMVGHLWCVSPPLEGGQLWVWGHGEWDVAQTLLEVMTRCLILGNGSMPTKPQM